MKSDTAYTWPLHRRGENGSQHRKNEETVKNYTRLISYIAYEQRTLMTAVFLLGLVLTLIAYILTPWVYKSEARFVVNVSPYLSAFDPQGNSSDASQRLIQSILAGIESSNMQAVLAGRLHVPYENLGFIGTGGATPSYDQPDTARIDARSAGNSHTAIISVYSQDPQFALRTAREIMNEVLSLNTLVGRIANRQTDLSVAQKKINSLTDTLVQTSADRIRLEQEMQSLNAHLAQGGSIQTYPGFQNDETLKKLLLQQITVPASIPAAQARPADPRARSAPLDYYAKQIAQALGSNLAFAQTREQSLEASLGQQRMLAGMIKDEIDRLTQATGSYQMRQDLRLLETRRTIGETAGVVIVTDPPTPSKQPVMPSFPLYLLIGLLCSGIAALAASILNHKLDRTVRNPKQLELLQGYACLALLPESETSSLSQPFGPAPEPGSVAGLSFLRSQMLRATLAGKAEKVFVFCGLGRHAESAELVTKLAVLLAKAEKKTLLIDFNFNNPQVAALLGIKSQKGLSEWMFSEDRIQNYIDYSVVRELAVIQPGRISGNVDDLISRRPLAPVLAQLQNEWDFILINSPNLLEESHLLLAASAGSPVVAVARYADAELDDLKALAARCEECNFVFAGIVLHHYPRARLRSRRAPYELAAHRYVLESTMG
jgi:Mrp family chromosome partitioning ATPase/uncharacterized protein involved in exopolysaccharide biosynthesis